jgi:BirA family biotin operon repressor/biotin-[acetyl-CoA-carboxylase] ligase
MNLEWFRELDSTMLEARRDPRPGRVIVADRQTAGMGRHGRVWHSPGGEGLYVSYVLAAEPAPVISLALGLAAREAIGAGDLRWPNDVLIRERKCCGVLAQGESSVRGSLTIAGIGINVAQREFPEGLETPATSLALEGIVTSREELLERLTAAVHCMVAMTSEDIIRGFSEASSYVSGRRVRAGEIVGVTCGLDEAGFLRVREDSGAVHTILNGGVRPV